jgi:hypothetical protein
MMGWLVIAELASLLTGLLLLLADKNFHRVSALLNKPIFYLDGLINSVKLPAGIMLVICGGWLISVALGHFSLWFLGALGAVLVLFGLLYLFLPNWLGPLSKISDKFIFSTDDFVLGARKSIGIILIVCALYIFFAAYLSFK